ncbi:DNA primase, partial [candidate division KSB3 bacterium]|nr:DNA primase [candidate division KSB3 bacterium]MBD3324010.1 DNA primase [candidate division KSB3 bacterium]
MARYIPEELIDEIRHHTDIVSVVSEYVALTKTGKNYKGLCPFHTEKTPSFVVNPAKQIFHCYGCGAGGNVFTFLMRHENYTFPEAVELLAKRSGIPLPSRQKTPQTPQARRTQLLYQVHQEAAQYFVQQLSSAQGQQTREYLKNRGITDTIIQKFSLGYALPGWDDLLKTLRAKYPVDLLLESGLIVKKQRGVGHYDRFRDRLIIPIHDARGRVVAFGGRIMGDGEPKYLNSPEHPVFRKGHLLYGLHQAKDAIRRAGSILIVEGYFDMIIPFSSGIEHIVATMGTALTEHHLRHIQRYTKKVVLIFDADPAGINAVQRTLDLFFRFGFDVRAAVLPEGDDPDSAVRKKGAEAFCTSIEQAPSLLDFIRERIIERYDLTRVEQQ